uniref:hypothetical protein n=1 Tax=Porphyromonas gingivalis TaxID=837 RepID=UPI0027B9A84A
MERLRFVCTSFVRLPLHACSEESTEGDCLWPQAIADLSQENTVCELAEDHTHRMLPPGQSHLDLSEILERIFKRLKINDVFLCSCSLHFVYLYLISSD